MKKSDYKVETLSINVDYDKNIYSAIGDGNYNSVYIFDDYFMDYSPEKSGKATIEVGLLSFDKDVNTKEILDTIKALGYRPAELYELLALGAQYPELQRNNLRIVALGTPRRGYVPIILGETHMRSLEATTFGVEGEERSWKSEYRYRFLIVKKSLPSHT